MYVQIVYTILLVGKQLHLFSWGEDLKLCMSHKFNIHKITVDMQIISSVEKYNNKIIVIKFYNICTVVNNNLKCDPSGLNDVNI